MDTTALDRQLSDFVHVLVTALRSGYTVRQTFEYLTTAAPEPTASVMKGWIADLEAGHTYDDGYARMCEAWPSPYLAQIIETIVKHQQVGGNLAFQLDPLVDQIYREIGTDGAFYPEMRIQAKQLGARLLDRVPEK
ncbi:MAG: type II secretion system F family protein [Anaerolineae bacterium]|nr:type II secretion system F family protein [Anaerolineae bacterium]